MCSFCGLPASEVTWLISGPGIYICERCVQICVNSLAEKGFKVVVKGTQASIDIATLGVKPRFKKLQFSLRENHIFLAAPLSEPFSTIYADHIKPVCKQWGFQIERADELFGDQPIVEDIWEAINSSQIILADVTGRNPNVMYEIGIAHTVGRPVVIMTQSMDDVPFDLKHYRCIVYDFTPRGCATLEDKLGGSLRFIQGSQATAKP
jgi:nucleoside 2-deoxyribosyltransferase